MPTILPTPECNHGRLDALLDAAASAVRDLTEDPSEVYSINIVPRYGNPTIRIHIESAAFDRFDAMLDDDPDGTLTGLESHRGEVCTHATIIYTQGGIPVEVAALYYDPPPAWLVARSDADLITNLSASVLADLAQRGPGRIVAVAGGYRWVRA